VDLNVLILSHEFPPYVFGGLGTYVYDISRALIENNVNVFVLTASYSKCKESKEVWKEDIVKKVPVLRIQLENYPFKDLRFGLAVRRILTKIMKEYKIDVVHTNPFYLGGFIREVKRYARVVISMHGSHYASLKHISSAFSNLRRFILTLLDYTLLIPHSIAPITENILVKELMYSDAIISPSIHTKSEISVSYSVDESKIVVIRPIINVTPDIATVQTYPKGVVDKMDIPVFIYAGRLTVIKGLIEFLNALNEINGYVHVYIFGDGPLKYVVKAHEKKVKGLYYMGKVSPRAWHSFVLNLKRAFFVYPSFWEAAPRALLEAYALGLPALIPNLEWAYEYSIMGQALLTDIFNKEDFKKVLEEAINIMNSSREYRKMSQRAKEYIRIFHNKERIVRELIKAYNGS